MRKFLFIFLFLVIGLFGALLIAPNFINWNEYRDTIAKYVYTTTGLNLEIRGDIKLEILPSPVLLINAVHVANIEGAMTSDTFTVKTIELRMALLALLGRQLKINTIKLVEPVLNIEILMDGRNNLAIKIPQTSAAELSNGKDLKATSPKSKFFKSSFEELKADFLSLSIDNFDVQNGFISYNYHTKGQVETIENLNGSFSLASSSGPMESEGSAIIRGVPINYSLATGSIVQDSTLPFNLRFRSTQGDTNFHFSGALTQINDSPKVKGKLNFNSKNLANFFSSIKGAPFSPISLTEMFSVKTSVVASIKGGTFSKIILNLGGTQGTGEISFINGKKTGLNIRFGVNKLNLDSILKSEFSEEKSNTTKVNQGLKNLIKNKVSPINSTAPPHFFGPLVSLRSIFKDINASLDITIASIIYNKAVVRQVKVHVNLEDQEIIISQASAFLPGSTDLGLQGMIIDGPKSQRPTFDGTVDLSTNNLRKLLNWTGVNLPGVPGDRLRKLTIAGNIIADTRNLSFNDVLAQIDGTRIKGKAAVRLDKRMLFDINLAISKLNLDGYLKGKELKKIKLKKFSSKLKSLAPADNKAIQTKSKIVLASPSILKTFDANINIKLDELVFKSLPIKKLIFNAKLNNNRLAISKFQVANVAGLSTKFSGNVTVGQNNHGLIDPVFNNLKFAIRGENMARALNFMQIIPAIPSNQMGPVQLSGRLNGKLKTLDLLADLQFLGGRFTLNGIIKPFSTASPVQAKISIFHPNIPKLVKKLGANYDLQKTQIGGVNLSGIVKGNVSKMNFSNISGKIGNIKIDGIVGMDLTEKIPRIDADLKTSMIVIDEFMPAQHATFLNRFFSKYQKYLNQKVIVDPRIKQASYSGLSRRIDRRPFVVDSAIKNISQGDIWSNKAIDISFLRQFSGDIKLRSKSLRLQKYQVEDVDLAAIITNGVFDLKRLTANAYDGTVELDGQVVASKTPNQFKTRLKVINVNTTKFLRSIGTNGFQNGALDLVCEVRAFGSSARKIVNALSGNGTFSVRGLGVVSKVKKGSAMSGVSNLFLSLQKFSTIVLGKQLNSNRTNFNTSFTAAKGVVSFKDMTLKTGLGNGSAKGLIDLPNWQINTDGEIKLSQNILTQILFKKSSKPIFLPFKLIGDLNDPHVKLETSEITERGIRLPNILNKAMDKLKQKKGLNTIFDNLLPKLNSGSKKNSPNQKIETEDLFKNILRELTN